MTRVAAIDCGTNSIRLLIADVESDGSLHEIDRRMTIVRLGEGVDATGRFSDAALIRTDRKSTRLNSSHSQQSRMPSSA